MNSELQDYLSTIKLGETQTYKHIAMVPLTVPQNGGPEYITLMEALETGKFTVTEVSEGGSVPELKVINSLNQAVLLLDGEELLGAKQNRVLNTTILLKELSETEVPVSCTEQGRWSYASPKFSSSDVIMSHKVRSRKSHSVSSSLMENAHFSSDQGEVWMGIQDLHDKVGSHSPTGAMQDAYLQRQKELDEALKSFPCLPGQNGLLLFMDGQVEGFDTVSRPEAYARLHLKLLRSYVIEALAESQEKPTEAQTVIQDKARSFMEDAFQCEEKRYPSIGHGQDCRYRNPGMAGSALVHENHVIHSAFFRMSKTDEAGRMSPLRHRRQRFEG